MEIKSEEQELLCQEKLMQIFIELYSLPKFADQIQNSSYDSQERNRKLEELYIKLSELGRLLNISNVQVKQNLTASKYFKTQTAFKKKLILYLQNLHPQLATFLLVDSIYKKLGIKYVNHCQELLRDIIDKKKQEEMRKQVQSFLEKKFQSYDIDKTGFLEIDELQKIIEKFKLPKVIAKGLMDNADQQKDGVISLAQFKKYTQKQVMKFYKIFYNLDSDNDQRLNYKQTKQSLHEIYPDINIDRVFKSIFKTMDQDKTGLITFEQWCQFLIIFPQSNLNSMINEWNLISSSMINPEQSSSFMDDDLLKGMKVKKGKLILQWSDIVKTLIFGGISGAFSRTVTAPLEKLKVLYQTMYTETKVPSITMGLKQSYQKHGLISLFKGNSISIFINCLEQALRFTIIQYSKKSFQIRGDQIQAHDFLFIGIITTLLSTSILFPFEVLRIRFIATDYSGRVLQKMQKIYMTSGLRGFYSGLTPHLISQLPAGSFNVMSYNLLRKIFVSDYDVEHPSIYKFMMIGGFASLVTNASIYPLSLLTSRLIMINKDIKDLAKKTKTHQLIKSIYQNEGLLGFYKGFKASTLRVFIGQALNFGTYQTLKGLWSKKSSKFNYF